MVKNIGTKIFCGMVFVFAWLLILLGILVPLCEAKVTYERKPVPVREQAAVVSSITTLFRHYNKKEDVEKYANYVTQFAAQYNVDPFVIAAMIVHESSARENAKSKHGDFGLMQVRWKVHKDVIMKKYAHVKSEADMLDAKTNIQIGTEIFSGYRERTKDLRSALLRYSAGNQPLADKIFKSIDLLNSYYRALTRKRDVRQANASNANLVVVPKNETDHESFNERVSKIGTGTPTIRPKVGVF